jgi:hypothetical protein
MSETYVLSPISDKSEIEATSQMLITPATSTAAAVIPFEFNSSTVVRRRPQSLFPSFSISGRPGGSAGGSDRYLDISQFVGYQRLSRSSATAPQATAAPLARQ